MPDIFHEVVIGGRAQAIYRAMTTTAGLSKWWTPDVATVLEMNGTTRIGFAGVYFKELYTGN